MARKTLGLRRNLKEEQRRADITKAAINTFAARGYQATTMDDIVMEAGCSKALIYWYWDSKAALFTDLVDICMTKYVELFQNAITSQGPYIEKLYNVLQSFSTIYRENVALNHMVHFAALQTSEKPEENFRPQVSAYKNQLIDLIAQLLQEGVDSGVLKPELDVSAVALHVVCLAEGYIYMSILEKRMPIERVLVDVLMNSLYPYIMKEDGI